MSVNLPYFSFIGKCLNIRYHLIRFKDTLDYLSSSSLLLIHRNIWDYLSSSLLLIHRKYVELFVIILTSHPQKICLTICHHKQPAQICTNLSLTVSWYMYICTVQISHSPGAGTNMYKSLSHSKLVAGCTHIHRKTWQKSLLITMVEILTENCTNIQRRILTEGCTRIHRNILAEGCAYFIGNTLQKAVLIFTGLGIHSFDFRANRSILSKNERMSNSLKKNERFTHSLIFGERNE